MAKTDLAAQLVPTSGYFVPCIGYSEGEPFIEYDYLEDGDPRSSLDLVFAEDFDRVVERVKFLERAFDQASVGWIRSGDDINDYNPFGFNKKQDGELFEEFERSEARKEARRLAKQEGGEG